MTYDNTNTLETTLAALSDETTLPTPPKHKMTHSYSTMPTSSNGSPSPAFPTFHANSQPTNSKKQTNTTTHVEASDETTTWHSIHANLVNEIPYASLPKEPQTQSNTVTGDDETEGERTMSFTPLNTSAPQPEVPAHTSPAPATLTPTSTTELPRTWSTLGGSLDNNGQELIIRRTPEMAARHHTDLITIPIHSINHAKLVHDDASGMMAITIDVLLPNGKSTGIPTDLSHPRGDQYVLETDDESAAGNMAADINRLVLPEEHREPMRLWPLIARPWWRTVTFWTTLLFAILLATTVVFGHPFGLGEDTSHPTVAASTQTQQSRKQPKPVVKDNKTAEQQQTQQQQTQQQQAQAQAEQQAQQQAQAQAQAEQQAKEQNIQAIMDTVTGWNQTDPKPQQRTINDLLTRGYTQDDINQALQRLNVNWNANCLTAARLLLRQRSYEPDDMVNTLIGMGFDTTQAQNAVHTLQSEQQTR